MPNAPPNPPLRSPLSAISLKEHMNQRDLESTRFPALTLDEEWILSARIMASEARGPMRGQSLEDLVAAEDREARRRRILFVIVLALFCVA